MEMLDITEKRLADLGVNVYDLPEAEDRDAYERAKKEIKRMADLIDRCETRINNLIVENEMLKDEWTRLTGVVAEQRNGGDGE